MNPQDDVIFYKELSWHQDDPWFIVFISLIHKDSALCRPRESKWHGPHTQRAFDSSNHPETTLSLWASQLTRGEPVRLYLIQHLPFQWRKKLNSQLFLQHLLGSVGNNGFKYGEQKLTRREALSSLYNTREIAGRKLSLHPCPWAVWYGVWCVCVCVCVRF